MDFSLNEVQLMLADSIEKFVANDYDFESRQKYSGSQTGYSEDVWKTFAELGWTAVPFSEDDGGFGGGPIDLMVVMERLGRGLVVEPYLANVVLAGGVLSRAANAAQKAKWLSPMIAGELQATLAFVEPQARYDIADVATTATRSVKGWVLNGKKAYVLNGGNADLLIVPARTSGGQKDADGITSVWRQRGYGGCHDTRLSYDRWTACRRAFLQDVEVGAEQLIGETDKGSSVLNAALARRYAGGFGRGCRHHDSPDREDY